MLAAKVGPLETKRAEGSTHAVARQHTALTGDRATEHATPHFPPPRLSSVYAFSRIPVHSPALVQPQATPQLQRTCACGNSTMADGECEECEKNRLGLQAKLKVNEPGDIYEQEADRIADR